MLVLERKLIAAHYVKSFSPLILSLVYTFVRILKRFLKLQIINWLSNIPRLFWFYAIQIRVSLLRDFISHVDYAVEEIVFSFYNCDRRSVDLRYWNNFHILVYFHLEFLSRRLRRECIADYICDSLIGCVGSERREIGFTTSRWGLVQEEWVS